MKINLMPYWRALGALFGLVKRKPATVRPSSIPIRKPEPVTPRLQALRVNRHVFELEDGSPFTLIGCTDFRLYQMFLNGEDIDAVLAQRRDLGFNIVRVLGMCRLMFELDPSAFANYYDRLGPFCEKLERFGLRLEFTAFADATLVMPDLMRQLEHWDRVCDALVPYSRLVLCELVNEGDQPVNAMSTQTFPQPEGLISSHGSNGSQALPVRPAWSYETFHTNDASEWWRKGSHNGMELSAGDAEGNITPSRVPVYANENTRPDRDHNPEHFRGAAAGCALLISGSLFHSQSGKSSALLEGEDLACAIAHIEGARSVDLRFQLGRYQHDPAWEGPDDLRVYRRVLDDGSFGEVRIRR